MLGKIKLVSEKSTEFTDHQTGEILASENSKEIKFREKEPGYIKLYLEGIGKLTGLAENNSTILYALLKRLEFGTNMIMLNAYLKSQIALECGVAVGSVNNTLSKLVKKNLFLKIGTGAYKANPMVFGSGSWDDIKKIRLEIEYSKDGFKMSSEFERERPKSKSRQSGSEDEIKAEQQQMDLPFK